MVIRLNDVLVCLCRHRMWRTWSTKRRKRSQQLISLLRSVNPSPSVQICCGCLTCVKLLDLCEIAMDWAWGVVDGRPSHFADLIDFMTGNQAVMRWGEIIWYTTMIFLWVSLFMLMYDILNSWQRRLSTQVCNWCHIGRRRACEACGNLYFEPVLGYGSSWLPSASGLLSKQRFFLFCKETMCDLICSWLCHMYVLLICTHVKFGKWELVRRGRRSGSFKKPPVHFSGQPTRVVTWGTQLPWTYTIHKRSYTLRQYLISLNI